MSRNPRSYKLLILAPLVLATCVRPADERYDLEREVGIAAVDGVAIEVRDQQAAVRELHATGALLWAQSPVLSLQLELERSTEFALELRNCMPDAVLSGSTVSGLLAPAQPDRPTWCVFTLDLAAGSHTLQIAPPDWEDETAFRFASMGDIQTAMGDVHQVFEKISETPDLRFVMSTGDVVEDGEEDEYELFEDKLAALNIPFFSTIGNHELTIDINRWHVRYGRFSVHFRFKGVDISYVDSGSATLDPKLYEALDGWLADGRDRIHVFGTHFPLFDPVGVRHGGFRNRNEAYKLLARLSAGRVDLTLYGHIHSLYEYDNANIPAYISGGGGAMPERFDGIDRHFLVIDANPGAKRIRTVEAVHVE